jgi:hypothetical protein
MLPSDRFEKAITTFDAYNLNDPHQELFEGEMVSKELLYAQRMSRRLSDFLPTAPNICNWRRVVSTSVGGKCHGSPMRWIRKDIYSGGIF